MSFAPKGKPAGKFGQIQAKTVKWVPMFKPYFFRPDQELKILCIGAHPDDIEIGCGGSILRIIEEIPKTEFYWVVFSGVGERCNEARKSFLCFLENVKSKKIDIHEFRESYFPFVGADIKDEFERLKNQFSPDVIFTHRRDDAHQDHSLISRLTWNTYRNHLVFEYEIPKFDGDLATPNLYIQLDELQVKRKIDLLFRNYETQKSKYWFTEETFRSILRIRGVESNSLSGHAEGFHCRKVVL
jgi:LmbE family N-acetylglucosaminyl deacetylase